MWRPSFRTVVATTVVLGVAVTVFVGLSRSPDPNPGPDRAPTPEVAAGDDPLAGIVLLDRRTRTPNYHREAFGAAWTDDTDAPLGHNGCDTRNDVLARDLVDTVTFEITRCPWAVRSGVLHDPYTGATIEFRHGNDTSAEVQVDHIVALSLAWDLGADAWTPERRARFANDPANLLAVGGEVNFAKASRAPTGWMPPNEDFRCDYARRFAAVLREYELPVDRASAAVLRAASGRC
ncbi:HNH endonuclease family protein [Rhodococcus kronopolitis]|uniref:HNH endonuclease family protein n=1 Tax=Rhodococcus kronopolitis TaxID=1460226 RepID=A0ABV9FPY8_9NOCA